MREVLWPEEVPTDGETVRAKLEALIEERLSEAPTRGKGDRRRRFLEQVKATASRYACGIYNCYDNPLLPQTTNEIEGKNGLMKHHQRKVQGRGSTVGGTPETAGEVLLHALEYVKATDSERLVEELTLVSPSEYDKSRKRLAELREPARKYRSIQRDPTRHLESTLKSWLETDVV